MSGTSHIYCSTYSTCILHVLIFTITAKNYWQKPAQPAIGGLCYTMHPKQHTIQFVAPRRPYMNPPRSAPLDSWLRAGVVLYVT